MNHFILAIYKPSGDSSNLEFGSLQAIKNFMKNEMKKPKFNPEDYDIFDVAKTHSVGDLLV